MDISSFSMIFSRVKHQGLIEVILTATAPLVSSPAARQSFDVVSEGGDVFGDRPDPNLAAGD